MAIFEKQGLTDYGRILLATVQSGNAVLEATRLVIGSGNMPSGATVEGMTDVVAKVKDLTISNVIKTNDGNAIYTGIYTNSDIIEDFYFREFALFARPKHILSDGSVTYGDEVLYAYANSGAKADLMPAGSAVTNVEKELSFVIYVGNDAEVSLTVDSGAAMSRGNVEAYVAQVLEGYYSSTLIDKKFSDFATSFNSALANYYQKTEINTKLSGYVTTEGLSTALSSYVTTSAMDNKFAGIATKTAAVSLPVASWSNNSQAVTVSGVTASNNVIVSPAPASAEAYAKAGIVCTAQAANRLTFTCKKTPTAALTVNVVILGV